MSKTLTYQQKFLLELANRLRQTSEWANAELQKMGIPSEMPSAELRYSIFSSCDMPYEDKIKLIYDGVDRPEDVVDDLHWKTIDLGNKTNIVLFTKEKKG